MYIQNEKFPNILCLDNPCALSCTYSNEERIFRLEFTGGNLSGTHRFAP